MHKEKPPRNRSIQYAWGYIALLPQLKGIAFEHGYALAVHGSLSTDLDLIAVPWVEDAADPEMLIAAFQSFLCGEMYNEIDENPSLRPHGRLAYSIYPQGVLYGSSPYIDISVMPKAKP